LLLPFKTTLYPHNFWKQFWPFLILLNYCKSRVYLTLLKYCFSWSCNKYKIKFDLSIIYVDITRMALALHRNNLLTQIKDNKWQLTTYSKRMAKRLRPSQLAKLKAQVKLPNYSLKKWEVIASLENQLSRGSLLSGQRYLEKAIKNNQY